MCELSVIMAAYNEERNIRSALASVLNQTYGDFEFIIVDDGSTDRTPEILQAYAHRDSRIKLLKQSNQGLTKALNAGLRIAKGGFIVRQDANDISLPRRFERQLAYMEEHPGTTLVGCDIEVIGDDEEHMVTIKNSRKRNLKKKIKRDNPICHGTFLFHRIIGGEPTFYNDFYDKAQDYDLVCRLSEKGGIAIVPEVLYKWRFSSSGILSTNVTCYSDRVRENHLRRKAGKPENFTPLSQEKIIPRPSEAHMNVSLGMRYLSGYELGKARRCFYEALRMLRPWSREYISCLRCFGVSCLPHFIVRLLRES